MAPIFFSALLFSACFPGTWFSPVVFIALSPFFVFLSKTTSFRNAFIAGAVFGAMHSVLVAYWVFNALYFHYEVNFFGSLLFLLGTISLPVAFLYGVFGVAYRFMCKDSMFFSACAVPSLWVIFDFLRDIVPLYLPWGFAGYSLAAYPGLVQMADFSGVDGITFCIVAVNSIIARAWLLSGKETFSGISTRIKMFVLQGNKSIIIALGIVVLMTVYGTFQVYRWNVKLSQLRSSEKITARVVQGSFALRERWDSSHVMELLETSLKLTGRLDDGRRYLVVWPETVLNAGGALRDAMIARIIGALGERNLLIFGGTRPGEYGNTYNSAYFVSGRGNVKVYDKIILLPFAETAPWGIHLLGNFYEAPVQFSPGHLPQVAVLEGTAVGFSICFEKIYSWFVRKSVMRGARILVNISNDSWFGRSTNPYQSLDASILRAVENRRYMVVSSNSGISAVITPTGMCAAKSGLFTEETIEAEVMPINEVSLYSRFGDWILYAALFMLSASIVVLLLKE